MSPSWSSGTWSGVPVSVNIPSFMDSVARFSVSLIWIFGPSWLVSLPRPLPNSIWFETERSPWKIEDISEPSSAWNLRNLLAFLAAVVRKIFPSDSSDPIRIPSSDWVVPTTCSFLFGVTVPIPIFPIGSMNSLKTPALSSEMPIDPSGFGTMATSYVGPISSRPLEPSLVMESAVPARISPMTSSLASGMSVPMPTSPFGRRMMFPFWLSREMVLSSVRAIRDWNGWLSGLFSINTSPSMVRSLATPTLSKSSRIS